MPSRNQVAALAVALVCCNAGSDQAVCSNEVDAMVISMVQSARQSESSAQKLIKHRAAEFASFKDYIDAFANDTEAGGFFAACKYDLVEMSWTAIVLGATLLGPLGAILALFPMLTKPYNAKSVKGMSSWTCMITNYQQIFGVINGIVLSSGQIKACGHDFIGCQPSLLALYNILVTAIVQYPQYLCFAWFPEDEDMRAFYRKQWNIQNMVLGGLLLVTTVWAMISDCDVVINAVGNLFGYGASVLMCVRFIPLLLKVIKGTGAGSLSYRTFIMMGVGGFAITYFQVFVSKERITTWLPLLVGNVMQSLILVIMTVKDCSRWCSGKTDLCCASDEAYEGYESEDSDKDPSAVDLKKDGFAEKSKDYAADSKNAGSPKK